MCHFADYPLLWTKLMWSAQVHEVNMVSVHIWTCRGKMDPPKLVLLWTNFFYKLGFPELCLLQKIWTTSTGEKQTLNIFFVCKILTSGLSRGFPRFLETTQACQFSSAQCTLASFPVELYAAFISMYIGQFLWLLYKATEAYWWKPVIQFSGYASVDTLSSKFTTIDMHWFTFMWLAYSGNKFRVCPNI